MKRFFFTCTVLAATVLNAHAQAKGGFAKGDKLLNAGIGLNSYYNGGIPLGVSLEAGISNVISAGVNADYLSSQYKFGILGMEYRERFTSLYFGARVSFHANELLNVGNEKADLYIGPTIGFRSFSFNDNFSSDGLSDVYSSGLFLGAYIGGRYYFSSKIGGFAELGAIGSTNARVGITAKF